MRPVFVIAFLGHLAACDRGLDCPKGTQGVSRFLHGGREQACEREDGTREGPYLYRSPTLKIEGQYLDGMREGYWFWTPSKGPRPRIIYHEGLRYHSCAFLRAKWHGYCVQSHSRVDGPDPYHNAQSHRESLYVCGLHLFDRVVLVDGRVGWGGPHFAMGKPTAGFAECLADLERVKELPQHPLMPGAGEPDDYWHGDPTWLPDVAPDRAHAHRHDW